MQSILGSPFRYRWFFAVLVIITLGTVWNLPAADQAVAVKDRKLPEGYQIGAGDVLQILVWREADASVPEAVVRVDGKITLPLIGDVEAAGLAPVELQDLLIKQLSRYLTNPVVTVITKEINSRKVYVAGNVKKEGPIPLIQPMTVLQALNEAGGLGDWASKKKIYVLRNTGGKQVRLPFDYKAVIKGQHLEQNIVVMPNDTIVVP
jgi:polysaccharide biosynthesis/export protein